MPNAVMSDAIMPDTPMSEASRIDVWRANYEGGTMSPTILERTADQISESAHQASRARAAKQSGDAAEEFLQDTTQRIQRHPALTVAATFAVGLAAGALIGLMIKRK
jgi:ElaB/YqjD/DUF883 family membrane-anchored ribosome-binding protein